MKVRVADEIANSVTHGFALLLSLIGLPVLIIVSLNRGDVINVIRASVIGAALVAAGLIALDAASTLYHAMQYQRASTVFYLAAVSRYA